MAGRLEALLALHLLLTLDDLLPQLASVERELGRTVNPTIYTPAEFRSKLESGNHFLNAVMRGKKVILIGEYAHLGKKHENKPLFISSLYKAVLFSALVFLFHVVEEVVKRLIHNEGFAGALREVRLDDLLARSLIIFCTFLPLFAFRELQRVMGEEGFRDLFFKTGANKPV